MLYSKIYEFMRHIETEYKSLTDDTGLNIVEIHAMRALFEKDGQKPTELALAIGRAPTAFTPILDNLEGKGFVRREDDPKDRRSIRVYLTALGEAERANIILYAEQADEQLQAEMVNFLPSEGAFMERFQASEPLIKTDVKEWLSLS